MGEPTFKIKEEEMLSVAITPGNFTEIKQILDFFSKMIDIKLEVKEPSQTLNYLIDGRCGEITLNEKTIGFIGEIHPKILKNWKIKMPVALFEISLEEIFEKLN